MSSDTREIGGNKLILWWGKYLSRIGNKYVVMGSKTHISNPSCIFPNAFTMIVSFTVNNKDKYQLVNQGVYKDAFRKQQEDENFSLSKDEMFTIITTSNNRWVKKKI